MKIIKINSKKQDNGLWGMTINCYKMDSYVQLNEKYELIRSAVLYAMNEKYNSSFSIFMSSEQKCYVQYDNINFGTFVINYYDYEVYNNKLYVFSDNNEHNVFLRKKKLQKICQTI